ncbi:RJL, Ras superfamily GTPase [Monocercomonoides exilis]|uniref:RJL, Ras superfamily GTPase n=1 Tax=Monocercomonoides exilis TaxID=2049356 RepID=UPI003559A523|nr:RJL, Ras superfamily GTPase [Monocercomonoides exilis]|eukprot:MONOS_16768.1-p1 / transcript=MONOS_16768.1 / gene=MONOS_16768 / organism=Monocercomonoides_exilis_PA203 / gene_product=RJL, Ras superfamily GTPase / transcript_product=RJL, Ras superfamily GTPase / location=Mono_scaffold00278:19966-20749(+) / protein_length=182 / sequence_SO=supercontig / SO=protein_coding / is_pseudo=false
MSFEKAPEKRQRYRIKIISMGDSGVGKSCLIKRFCEKKFVSKYISTIGVDFGMKPIDVGGVDVRVNLFDFAGADCYLEIRNEFYRDSEGAILVFDVNSRPTFLNIQKWIEESEKYGAHDMIITLIGNKIDLKKRQVSEKEAQSWAIAKGFRYIETSSATGEGVDTAFLSLISAVADKHKQQ